MLIEIFDKKKIIRAEKIINNIKILQPPAYKQENSIKNDISISVIANKMSTGKNIRTSVDSGSPVPTQNHSPDQPYYSVKCSFFEEKIYIY